MQQCWIRLHTSSNIVEATCAPRWLSNSSLQSLKPRGKGRSNSQALLRVVGQQCCVLFHGALWVVSFARCTAVSTLLGVVASVCTPLPTRTKQLTPNIVGPTMLGVVAYVCTWLKVFYSSKLHKSDIFVTISTKKWEVLPRFFFQDDLAFLIFYRITAFDVYVLLGRNVFVERTVVDTVIELRGTLS